MHPFIHGYRPEKQIVTNFSKAPKFYSKPEGIFPDGKFTDVEVDLQCQKIDGPSLSEHRHMDVKLDGIGKDFRDYQNFKAPNPAVL